MRDLLDTLVHKELYSLRQLQTHTLNKIERTIKDIVIHIIAVLVRL